MEFNAEQMSELKRLQDTLQGRVDALATPRIQQAISDLNEINTSLQQMAALAEQMSNGVRAAVSVLDEVKTGIGDQIATLHEHWNELEEAHAEAITSGESALDGLAEHANTLREQFEALGAEVQERVEATVSEMMESLADELLEPLNEFRAECLEKIEALVVEVVDEILPEKAAEVTEEWIAAIREELQGVIEGVQNQLDEFRSEIIGGKDKAGEGRSTSAEAAEILRTAFEPVTSELERVRGLAGMVGISI
jgi:archaellum component FlaC